jgi:hypothetical protein
MVPELEQRKHKTSLEYHCGVRESTSAPKIVSQKDPDANLKRIIMAKTCEQSNA